METQMWKRSSCLVLSGVIKERLGHTERTLRPTSTEESARLTKQLQQPGFLQLVTVRDFKQISLIVEAPLRPSACGRAGSGCVRMYVSVCAACVFKFKQTLSSCANRAEPKLENNQWNQPANCRTRFSLKSLLFTCTTAGQAQMCDWTLNLKII